MLKIVIVNIVLLLALLFILIASPAIIDSLEGISDRKETHKLKLPNYRNVAWAKNYFSEHDRLQNEYFDFIGWKSKPTSGKSININKDGFRIHGTRLSESKVWFFGGSTMWGFGDNDESTIPKLYENISGMKSFNMGELGYTAHQSLNLFQKLLTAGAKPKRVYFYDGANEVAMKCRRELGFYSTDYELEFRRRIDTRPESFGYLFRPIINKLSDLVNSDTGERWDCDKDPAKAKEIALALYYDWEAARHLAKLSGSEFVAVLQPVAYLGTPNLSHLPKVANKKELRRQYKAVYAEIRNVLKEKNFPYLDLTDAYDGNDFIYIDFCHVTPNGNRKVAEALASDVPPIFSSTGL